ncbi:putative zinc-binding metallopeptidase [Planctomycetota bacterium]|nr:putative zinc-binding metallopeptidase [Planctomycetota bacterium]
MTTNGRKTRCISHTPTTSPAPYWARWSFNDILDLRFCDLDLTLNSPSAAPLRHRIDRLYHDLDRTGFTNFKPHCWLSTEWFSPDGVPGIALPFYLAHPKLAKLEKKQMLSAEGNPESECLKILRHEAGHAINTAYRLHYRKAYRQLFGSYADPYPETYKPKPNSQKYVHHLDYWYAQAHPAEDFAETFAVWLAPKSNWRKHYKNWPAIHKLEYVDTIMKEIVGTPTKVRSKRHVEPLKSNTQTLREHYRQRRLTLADEFPSFFDTDLTKLFSNEPKYKNRRTAASFLRDYAPELRSTVAHWTAAHPYTIDQVLRDMIDRCKELRLHCKHADNLTRSQAHIMLTVQTMNYIHSGHFRVPL